MKAPGFGKRIAWVVANIGVAVVLLVVPVWIPSMVYAWLFPFWWKTADSEYVYAAMFIPWVIIFYCLYKGIRAIEHRIIGDRAPSSLG